MKRELVPIKDNRALTLLQAGRDNQVVSYDVEAGLSRCRHLVGSGVPLPEWAQTGATVSAKTGIVLGKIIPYALLPVAAITAVVTWNSMGGTVPTRNNRNAVPNILPAAAVDLPKGNKLQSVEPVEPIKVDNKTPSTAPDPTEPLVQPTIREKRASRKVQPAKPLPVATRSTEEDLSPNTAQAVAHAPSPQIIGALPKQRAPGSESLKADSQFEREIGLVAAAERMLQTDPKGALSLAKSGEATFSKGYFSEERRYIIVSALVRLGRVTEARTGATRFFNDYPNSHFGPRIRQALSDTHAETTR